MQAQQSYRGWVVSIAVAGVITYFVLAAERDFRRSHTEATKSGVPGGPPLGGIWVNADPTITVAKHIKPAPVLPSLTSGDSRRQLPRNAETAQSLSLPPEPVATVVLHAPTAIPEMVAISISEKGQNDRLVSAIDRAFDSPIREVALQKPVSEPPEIAVDQSRLANLKPVNAIGNQLPEPNALLRELAALREASLNSFSTKESSTLSRPARTNSQSSNSTIQLTRLWADETEICLRRLMNMQGLAEPTAQLLLDELLALTAKAAALTSELDGYDLSAKLGATAYSLERRVRVWQAISAALQSGSKSTDVFTADLVALERINSITNTLSHELNNAADGAAWRAFLKLDELLAWSNTAGGDSRGDWTQGNELATQILTRLTWERLTIAQRSFLAQPNFQQLSKHLAPWATQPIDFRQLLIDIEQLEEDPINRCRASIAHTVQVLRISPQPNLRLVAETINDHYRNANVRISISNNLIQRMLPNETLQTRPVRQRILGADTKGNSQVRTELQVKLIPDPNAWHLQLGLSGDMQSATQSSKGPKTFEATFHQTSVAQIQSARTIRMDLNGVKISADPTSVDTNQHLRSMSTNLDKLPVVGDFFRAMVREQFDQQRGVAQRIVKRIIAEETDQELDSQLREKMASAEKQLQHTFIGPLERLKLNPMVVSMNTTDDRLTVRYRLASESQLSANTARPRAPGDSLMSMQIHQSAINNTLSQLGLNDRTWTIPELSEKLCDTFDQAPWPLPKDLPEGITIRFAPTRPITVELINGRLELTLRIAEMNHPQRKMNFQRFVIKACYIPVAKGMEATLVRDGSVSIDGPRLGMAEKVPLRGIFGVVFAPNSALSLIHRQWKDDPRSQGLAVSQVEVRDGWLSVAVSEQGSEHAARVARASEAIVRQ